jgi:hypothetical protein
MAEVLSQQLRREIRTRAGGRCEYCLMDETFLLSTLLQFNREERLIERALLRRALE